MGSMSEWAEQECRLACKRENPEFNFDSDDFDYGCSCYKSALKAYKSLCDDGHSGMSFGFTKNILIQLMEGLPLTPIKDEDFFINCDERMTFASDEWLKVKGLKSDIQCPRMYSLFRTETLDGKVAYHDTDRAYYIDVESPSDCFSSSTDFLDEMFPITMPYMPSSGKYKIYCQTFLSDKRHGDFDTRGILYMTTPDNERVELNIYETEDENGHMHRITKEEYEELLKHRVDRLNVKIADRLLWSLISNTGSDEEIERKEAAYKGLSDEYKNEVCEKLERMCEFFENPDNYEYNTYHTYHALCDGDESAFSGMPELLGIMTVLKHVKTRLEEQSGGQS